MKTRALLALFVSFVTGTGWLAGSAFERMRGSHLFAEEGLTPPLYQDYRFLIAGTTLLLGCVHLLRLRRRGHRIFLGLVQAEPLQERRLRSVVEEMSIAAMVPAPQLYLVEHPTPNAFALGWDEEHSAVAVTRGLLEMLDRDELQAVVAHEIAHIRNGDTKLLTLLVGMSRAASVLVPFALGPLGAAWTMALDDAARGEAGAAPVPSRPPGPPTPAADWIQKEGLLLLATPFAAIAILVVSVVVSMALVLVFAAVLVMLPVLALIWALIELLGLDVVPEVASGGGTGLKSAGWFAPVGLLLGPAILLVGVCAPLSLLVLRMAIHRSREFDADAGAVELTRNPLGLLGALRKLEARSVPDDTPRWPAALGPLCIHRQDSGAEEIPGLHALVATHPPLAERIRRVEAMLAHPN